MSNRTLLLIDVQRNMLLPPLPVPDAPAVGPKIAEILHRARRAGWELIHDVAGPEAVVDKRWCEERTQPTETVSAPQPR